MKFFVSLEFNVFLKICIKSFAPKIVCISNSFIMHYLKGIKVPGAPLCDKK